jgi:hypothetical protein
MKCQIHRRLSFVTCTLVGFWAMAGCSNRDGLHIDHSDAGSGVGGKVGSGGVQTGTGGSSNVGGAAGPASTGGIASTTGPLPTGGVAGIGGGKTDPLPTGGVVMTGGTTKTGGKSGSGGAIIVPGTGGAGGNKDGGVRPDVGVVDAPKDSIGGDTPSVPDAFVRPDVMLICPPICEIFCPYGNVYDVNGCPTCQCLPGPCLMVKCKACTYGYIFDENNCQTCTCAPAPESPCGVLTDYVSCASNGKCTWLEPGCGTPALVASGCFDTKATNCTSDTDCADGLTCLKRVINPCAQLDCNACSKTITICM